MKYNFYESVFRPTGKVCKNPYVMPLEDGAIKVCWTEKSGVKSAVRDAKGKWSEITEGGFVPPYFRMEDGTELCAAVKGGRVIITRYEDGKAKRGRAEIAMADVFKNSEHETDGFASPTFYSDGGKDVHVLMTSTVGTMFRADSRDNGKTWTRAFPINFPCTASKMSCVLLPDLKVYALLTVSASKHTPLVLAESGNFGSTFKKGTVLASGWGEFTDAYMMNEGNKLNIVFVKNSTEVMLAQVEL